MIMIAIITKITIIIVVNSLPHMSSVTQVKVDQVTGQWSGSLQIGLTSMAISDSTPMSLLPADATKMN